MSDADPLATISASLLAKTGKDLDAWTALARASGIQKHKMLVDHLKAEHGLTHGYANTIALKANASDAESIGDAALLEAMFAGPKAALKPIYEQIVALAQGFGGDVELAPKKGYVSLRRSKQFAIAQPTTKDRFDLGLNLKGRVPEGRLEASGSFNAMVSHRIRFASLDDIDDAVIAWLRAAYDAA